LLPEEEEQNQPSETEESNAPAANLFSDTIGIANETALKDEGYVIVRYFYNQNCPLCLNPTDWGGILDELAAVMNGKIIVEKFDTVVKKWARDNWATIGFSVADNPAIRLEGMQDNKPAYKIYFGGLLTRMADSPKEKLKAEICSYTEKC